jgi:mRNA interferase HigB
MEIFGRKVIEAFKKDHANSRKPLRDWMAVVEAAQWTKSTDVIATFKDATNTNSGWVFNVGGNNFRLLADIAFTEGLVLVIKIGTHAEYDRWIL